MQNRIDKEQAKRHFENFLTCEDPVIEGTKHLAEILNLYNPDELDHTFEWVFEKLVQVKMPHLLSRLLQIYNILVERQYTEDSPHVCNDLEDYLFTLPHATFKVFAATTQNRNYIVIIDDTHYRKDDMEFHVRRYWDEFNWEETENEEEELKERGGVIQGALEKAKWYCQHVSDYYEGCRWVDRPSLQWFKDRNFDLEFKDELHGTPLGCYGDCRDAGFVISGGTGLFSYGSDNTIYHYSDIQNFFWLMGVSLETLLEEEEQNG